jgi:hypothetical protein
VEESGKRAGKGRDKVRGERSCIGEKAAAGRVRGYLKEETGVEPSGWEAWNQR